MNDWRLQRIVDQRLRRLEQKNATQASVSPGDNNMRAWFRVTPTCPPSTSVWMRGGTVYASPDGPGSGEGLDIEATQAELGADGIDGGAPAFTTADYYRALILVFNGEDFWYYWNDDTELDFETAAEAEDNATTTLYRTGPYLSDLPLCIIIVRNDGTVGVDGAILPIDAVNRGRSYLWRDIRPRYMISASL